MFLALSVTLYGQTPPRQTSAPAWAEPGSAGHPQVPPPTYFHRPTTTIEEPIGVFEGQSDVGSALAPGSASFDAATGKYTIHSAGYNIWYTRDEFRYLWRRMSGDVSLASDIEFPDPNGYGVRKAVLVIRQSLEDGSKETVIALLGSGIIDLAWRPKQDGDMTGREFRIGARGRPASPDTLVTISAKRIGVEKRGDEFTLWVSVEGEPMHQFGQPMKLHLDAPFYVGVGFVSHLPTTVDTVVMSNVVLENVAGKVR